MKNIKLFLFSLILISFFTCSRAIGGTIKDCKVKINGLERSYFMYLPDNLPVQAPLVIVLHGYGGKADPEGYGMNEIADINKFAVCYPQGVKDSTNHTGWNVKYPFQASMKVDDVDYICKLTEHLQKTFNLSKKNSFCTGMSNGGDIIYQIALERPDCFAAMAPIAGLTFLWMYKELPGKSPIPIFEIHGTEDRVSEWTGDLTNQGGWGPYISVPLAVNYWVAQNRCTQEITDTIPGKDPSNGHYIITHKYINGIKGNQVWLYEIVNGSHSWASKDLNTSEEIWKFFSLYLK